MPPRTYAHAGREVSAMRFVGNGPEVAAWAGAGIEARGHGLSGSLALRIGDMSADIECGDWVVKDGAMLIVVPQEIFIGEYKEVRRADVV